MGIHFAFVISVLKPVLMRVLVFSAGTGHPKLSRFQEALAFTILEDTDR